MHNTEVKDTPSHVVKYVDLNLSKMDSMATD